MFIEDNLRSCTHNLNNNITMKKITILFCFLIASVSFAQVVVLEDFEGTPPADIAGFEGLGSAALAPDPTNGSNTVLEIVSADSGQPWQGAEVLMQSNYMNVEAGNMTVEVDVYSTVAFNALGKLENGVAGAPDSAQEDAYTATGTWQTMTFTFNDPLDTTTESANGDYGKFAIFPNWASPGWNDPAGNFTIYIDNISAVEGAVVTVPETCDDGIMNQDETGIDCGGVCAPCTAGTPEILEDFEGTPAADFAGFEGLGSAALATDPTNGGNTVLEIISADTGQPWQGAEVLMQENYMDVTNPLTVSVDVYSNVAFNALGKVENGQDGAPDSAQEGSYTATGTWQTMTFTFDNPLDTTTENANGDYEKFSIFPNWASPGWNDPAGNFTIYIDNISAVRGAVVTVPETCDDGIMNQDETGIDCGGVCAPCTAGTPEVLEDFEGTPPADVSGFEGLGSATIVADPTSGGNNVLEIISVDSGQGWQGAGIIMQEYYMDVTNPLTVSVDVYSSVAFDLLGKVEDGQGGAPDSAQEGSYSATGTWQTITFTFDNPLDTTVDNANGDYRQLSLFPNWNGAGWNVPPANFTILVDNVTAVRGAAISLGIEEFNSSSFIAYPNPSTINWTVKGNNTISNVTVFDVLGKVVRTLNPNENEVEISTSGLNSGIYFAKIEGINGSQTIRLIKE